MSSVQPEQPIDGLRRRHLSTSSSSSSSSSSTLTTKTKPPILLHFWDDLPPWRRDNAFILSGYRTTQPSYTHALHSLFYLHNESVNIWTHLIGAIVAVFASLYLGAIVRPRYASASPADGIVFACFFAGAVLCLGMSATFHALVGHSEVVARWGNKLDYTGIVLLIVGSNVPTLYYGFFCRPGLMRLYLALICVLGVGSGLVSWIDQFRKPQWRPYRAMLFIGLGVSGAIPAIHGLTIYGYQGLEDRMSISWVISQGAMYIFGALLYALRWPERSFPGSFDIWGSSHQIFHLFVLMAAGTHLYGMARAFDYHHTIMGSHCLMD